VTGDRFWPCHKLAAAILRRLVARYGPGIVIVHGDDTGVEESFATAAKGLRITTEAHPADFDYLGDGAEPFRNREMVRAGTREPALHSGRIPTQTHRLGNPENRSGTPPAHDFDGRRYPRRKVKTRCTAF
jgi:hypothetical protein